MFEGQPKGFPFGDFDLEDVMLPENDDMGIPSDTDEDGQEEDLQTESGFGNVLGAGGQAPHAARWPPGASPAASGGGWQGGGCCHCSQHPPPLLLLPLLLLL